MIKPRRIRIELSTCCNLRCSFCSYRKEALLGLMNTALFQRILEQLTEFPDLEEIGLFNIGEPLLHPEFDSMIVTAAAKNLPALFTLSTNAMLLDERKSLTIIESGIFKRVFISLDAATKATYQKLRIGGDFELVLSNVRKFLELRKGRKPFVDLQFILMPENLTEMEQFIACWKDYFAAAGEKISLTRKEKCDRIIVFPFVAETRAEQEKTDRFYHEMVRQGKLPLELTCIPNEEGCRKPCAFLYDLLAVNFNGNVTPCCTGEKMGRFVIGNALDQSLLEIWNGPVINSYRTFDLAGDYREMEICRHCFQTSRTIPQGNWLSPDRVEKYRIEFPGLFTAPFSEGLNRFRQNDFAGAITGFREAYNFNPYLIEAAKHLAICLQNTGEFREALTLFEQVLKGYPQDAVALKGLACCLDNLGEKQRSREIFHKLATGDFPAEIKVEAEKYLTQIR
ncbi:MAG: radical SAM protein [Candidatus Wallbacteria bacterium]|nr:radical SAM protein [Candidatus Wallbacteria bacterium]